MLTHNTVTAKRGHGGLDMTLSLTADQAEALGTDAAHLMEYLDTVLVGVAALRTGYNPVPAGQPSLKDAPVTAGVDWDEWLLRDVAALLTRLEGVRDAAIRAHREHGGSYGALAAALGVPRGTAQTRRDALTETPTSAAELWARGGYAPADHPGVRVPESMRSWKQAWHAYLPVDVTPPELRAGEGLAASVAAGWAEPAASPDEVTDWGARHRQALVPFERDSQGWPLNPSGRTGRAGRNLGRWGENAAADPIVVTGTGPDRQVLLILRGDIRQWAIPGGMVDPGETAPAALVRELREETGVDLTEHTPTVLDTTYVTDWRATDHAWVCSTVALYQLSDALEASGADDALEARWWPLDTVETLAATITASGGQLYDAHRPLLSKALHHLAHSH